ncbi:hypothetical protein [Flavisolibacter tropicus]|uniref:Uncharacterized protein n=1 Tax=Flavisolibacter tropicus TaxID=1492898 RepID=A0A172TWC6_9BACT|nr:hypothetical protein [Flavisolibacter tropicus]ANE51184.1 hypothetical protein SY85_12400 [Flavisolibacter tropicus]
MKKLLLCLVTAIFSLTVFAATPTIVNEKVLKAFNASFKDAQQVIWEEHTDVYEVKFVQNQIRSRVTYDVNGNILKTMRYYYEDQLPIFIRGKLKQKFPGTKVFGVTEVATPDQLNYHIVLEGAKHWTIVVCDSMGYMMVDKKYNKA